MTIVQIIIISILVSVALIGAVIALLGISWTIREKRRFNDIKDREVKNDLYRIYMDIDIMKTKEIIDNILKEHISKWIMINITSQGDNYIKDQEVSKLINDVTSKFLLEMSDVHLFYLKCLYNITDDDTLIYYVREEVKFLVLEIITDFNKTE